MALMKCPECKKKISDTVDKCPQCGFDLSKDSKEDLKVKEVKLDSKTIIKIVVVVVILLVVVLGYKMLFPANGRVNKAVRYLESEGYECDKKSSVSLFHEGGEYICVDEDSNDNRKEFIITWKGGIPELITNVKHYPESIFDDSFDADFYFYNDEDDYVYIYPEGLGEPYAYSIQDSETNESLCLYVTEGSDEDNRIPLGNKDLEVDYSNCDSGYSEYLDDINDSLNDIRYFLEEMDMN